MPPLSTKRSEDASNHRVESVNYKGKQYPVSFHLFVNQSQHAVKVFWVSEGHQKLHGEVKPGCNLYAGTCDFHTWRITTHDDKLLTEYSGGSVTVTINSDGSYRVTSNVPIHDVHPEWGSYEQRSSACHIPIMAYRCVSDAAIQAAEVMLRYLLGSCPLEVQQNMVAAGACVAVIGRHQAICDMPPHRFMLHNSDRDLNSTCRGLGGTRTVPTTSVAEENLLMDDRRFHNQNLFVHEFAHAIQNIGLSAEDVAAVKRLYLDALQQGRYLNGIYMMTNEQEYWAVAAESWLESSSRKDVNGGVCTREALKEHDPGLAALLGKVFGDSPQPFSQVVERIRAIRETMLQPQVAAVQAVPLGQ